MRRKAKVITSCCGRIIFALVLLTTLASISARPVTAQVNGEAASAIGLVSQTDWNTGTNPFDIEVSVGGSDTASSVEIVVSVYNAVRSRSQYLQTLDNQVAGSPFIIERRALASTLDAAGNAFISLPIQDKGQPRYAINNPGVYPVEIELRKSGSSETLSSFVTHIILTPPTGPSTQPLGVATVLPAQVAQSTDKNDLLAVPDSGKPLTTISQTLAAHPATSAEVLVAPESVDRLDRAAKTTAQPVTDLQVALGNRSVLQTTWAQLPAQMYQTSMASELNRQMSAGQTVLRSNFDNITTNTWAATEQLDNTALASLKTAGYERFVLPDNSLLPTSLSTTLARPFVVSLGRAKGTAEAGVADRELAAHFSDPNGPILGAHRLLADMAVLWNDYPAQQRSVIVMPNRAWNPDPGFLETLFRGLDTSPILKAQSLDGFFSTPPERGATPLVRNLAPISKGQVTNFPTNRISEVRDRVTGFSSLVANDNVKLSEFDDQLLLAERAELDQRARADFLTRVQDNVDHEIGLIHLPGERSIRLTARQGEIPISVQNDTGYEVHLIVELSSNKLTFPDGNTRSVTLSRAQVTEGFTVDARTSGAFPLQVRLLSPDGETTLERGSITVRSTATSGLGVGLSIGAGAFLILWWIRAAYKKHHRKKALSNG